MLGGEENSPGKIVIILPKIRKSAPKIASE